MSEEPLYFGFDNFASYFRVISFSVCQISSIKKVGEYGMNFRDIAYTKLFVVNILLCKILAFYSTSGSALKHVCHFLRCAPVTPLDKNLGFWDLFLWFGAEPYHHAKFQLSRTSGSALEYICLFF